MGLLRVGIEDSFFVEEILPLFIETIGILLLYLFNLGNICVLENL
jgi:hypothetical protein